MNDLHVSWDEYYRQVERLAVCLYRSGWTFDQIVCLARGGLRAGDILSRIFQRPLAILSASSYGGADGRTRGSLVFSRDLAMTTPGLGRRILLVDDLADSGSTLEKAVEWLHCRYGFYIEEVRTAVLWCKGQSGLVPDYYVDYLPDNPWIHQPFEFYENLQIEDLARQYDPRPGGSQKDRANIG